jgi:hypothetical protein
LTGQQCQLYRSIAVSLSSRDLLVIAHGHALYSLDLLLDQPQYCRSWRHLTNHPDYDVWAIF